MLTSILYTLIKKLDMVLPKLNEPNILIHIMVGLESRIYANLANLIVVARPLVWDRWFITL